MGLTWKDKDSVNDLVALIPGASVPFVLRPVGREGITISSSSTSQSIGGYQLVDVTYIHGIMDGEFFKKKEKKNNNARQVQLFTLH